MAEVIWGGVSQEVCPEVIQRSYKALNYVLSLCTVQINASAPSTANDFLKNKVLVTHERNHYVSGLV